MLIRNVRCSDNKLWLKPPFETTSTSEGIAVVVPAPKESPSRPLIMAYWVNTNHFISNNTISQIIQLHCTCNFWHFLVSLLARKPYRAFQKLVTRYEWLMFLQLGWWSMALLRWGHVFSFHRILVMRQVVLRRLVGLHLDICSTCNDIMKKQVKRHVSATVAARELLSMLQLPPHDRKH